MDLNSQLQVPDAAASDTYIHTFVGIRHSLSHTRAHTHVGIKVLSATSCVCNLWAVAIDLASLATFFWEEFGVKGGSLEDLLFWLLPRLRWVEGLLLFTLNPWWEEVPEMCRLHCFG